ncbi:MAG: winged helix-turn-helix domain-containing protein [Candidatus Palauibacterales bacterium]|nr:winged helix-turn-helix domain-containing protein [Candidatus Palauibacterales bacterium]
MATRRPGPVSVLRDVSVDRDRREPPGRQLERQLAVMVRTGRLEPGRRLPSTRRLAAAVGLHRNTVAAAYRRLAGRELLVMRHGARARVASGPDGEVDGPVDGVLAAAGDGGTARLLAAELRAALPRAVDVEPAAPGTPPGKRQLVAALPGPALRRAGPESSLGLRQDRREAVRAALRRAPPLAVVAVLTGCPALREAVLSDVAGLRREDLSLHAASVSRPRREIGTAISTPAADLVIADRLAADAFCGASTSSPGPAVVPARLVCRDGLEAVARAVGGPGA